MKNILYIALALFLGASQAQAQAQKSSIEYAAQAHFSLGGSTPLGFPISIREIERFNPGFKFGLEVNATKWINSNWGVRAGVRFEEKGMKTKARVKNYLTEIVKDQSKVKGYYTGRVETNVSNTFITIPVLGVYQLSKNWNLYAGPYFSALLDNTFDGYVSDGYIRQGNPTGPKITFEEGSQAPYDFSEEVRPLHWGAQLGGEWTMNGNFKLFSDLTYGINNLFRKDFTSIDFDMHNVYVNIGFGYKF